MIEKDGEFFDFDGEIVFDKSVKTLNNIDSGSTFSYQSEMVMSDQNKRLLKIENWDGEKIIYNNINVTVHLATFKLQAKLRVEGTEDGQILFSLFTDAYDFINSLTGTLKDVNYKDYPIGNLASRRTNTSGYVDFLTTVGSNPFDDPSLITSLYVKDIMTDIFAGIGVKLKGDIISDWRFNHLFVTNDSVYIEYDERYISEHTFFVGKQVDQTIPALGVVLTFPNETGIFYDPQNWWSTSQFTPEIGRNLGWEINIITDTIGTHLVEVLDDLSNVIDSTTFAPATRSISWTSVGTFLSTRVYTIKVTPASGSIQVSSSSTAKFYVVNEAYFNEVLTRFTLDEFLPRFIVPEMDTKDFVTQIFSMFNPIMDFNPNSKELTVDFFDKILQKDEEDWSGFLASYQIDTSQIVEDYGKRSFLNYDEGDEVFLQQYNKRQPVPYGSGVLNVNNDFIAESEDILDVEFPPTMQELNNAAQAYLPTMIYYDENNNETKFTHRLLLGVVDYAVSNFSNLTSIGGVSSTPYGWFSKPNVGKPVDGLKHTIAFDNPSLPGFTQLTLKDDYFKVLGNVLNDPVLVIAQMYIPAKDYMNFDPSKPKRLKTSEFNSLFMCRSISGWVDGHTLCEVELMKLK